MLHPTGLWDNLVDLLTCAEDLVDPVGRAVVFPDAEAVFDDCCDGTLWVRVDNIQPGWPEPEPQALPCSNGWTATIELGIVRCAAGTLDDQGNSPTAEQITADALQQNLDRSALSEAIECCWNVTSRTVAVESWVPLDGGGCIGGVWTIRLRVSDCPCPSGESL